MEKNSLENNWFKQQEKDLLMEAAEKRNKRLNEATAKLGMEEVEKIRVAHWMKCPKCGHDMKEFVLEGIEVEQCTFCSGVYFDRGEIESLLLRKTPQRFTFFRKFFGLD